MNRLTPAQVKQLLAPIRGSRVLQDPRGNSHVSQQDVTAHLTRIFGFGNFDTTLLTCECIFEEPRRVYNEDKELLPITHQTRWDVGYRATFRLTVKNPNGTVLATYEDGSCGDAQNQVRWDAHDNAMKTAISTAKKRCCINLGDQFGLSLYNKGQRTALVRGTLILPEGWEAEQEDEKDKDMQDGVEQQVAMGNDEVEKNPEPTAEQTKVLRDTLGAEVIEDSA